MASFFFIILYSHFFKAFLYFRFRLKLVWFIGLLIFLFLILEAFLGYTLIWSQISFWAATVITSLIRVIPLIGLKIIVFIWGGFYLNSFSLKFFFFFHFILPLIIFLFIVFHLIFLHVYGRSNKLLNSTKINKRTFFPFYWVKDFVNLGFIFFFFILIILFPFYFNEPLSFVNVNNLVSPIHIVPEWYFLWVYAILRAFPLKRLGVFIILFRILILFFLNKSFFFFDKIFNSINFFFLFNWILLTWLGAQEPFFPFVNFSLIFSLIYFFFLIIYLLL